LTVLYIIYDQLHGQLIILYRRLMRSAIMTGQNDRRIKIRTKKSNRLVALFALIDALVGEVVIGALVGDSFHSLSTTAMILLDPILSPLA
jgi:hypothetical protein